MKRTGFLLLLSLLLLASCTRAPKPERVSDEEFARLREEYPYNDLEGKVLGQRMETPWITDFASYVLNSGLTDCAVLEIVGDWYTLEGSLSPYGNPEQDAVYPGAAEFVYSVIDARAVQVLTGSNVQEGQAITISFGPREVSGGTGLEEVYRTGRQLVCFLQDFPDNAFGRADFYRASKDFTYYLTPSGAVLSVTSLPYVDECSGMYLGTFEETLREVLLPGAEITAPTPETEAE